MSQIALPTYIGKFLGTTLKGVSGFSAALPGGVWRGVAPQSAIYPFLTYDMVSGDSKLAVDSNGHEIGGNLLYLLKVTDRSDSSVKAQDAAGWLVGAIAEVSGSAVLGGFVYGEELSPYDMGFLEGEVRYQQIGGTYRFYVDRG